MVRNSGVIVSPNQITLSLSGKWSFPYLVKTRETIQMCSNARVLNRHMQIYYRKYNEICWLYGSTLRKKTASSLKWCKNKIITQLSTKWIRKEFEPDLGPTFAAALARSWSYDPRVTENGLEARSSRWQRYWSRKKQLPINTPHYGTFALGWNVVIRSSLLVVSQWFTRACKNLPRNELECIVK